MFRCLDTIHRYKPEVGHLRVFGCKYFSHIPKDERRKLDAKSSKCIFIGYCDDHKVYKLFDTSSHKLIASRDVVLHENPVESDNTSTWSASYHDDYIKIETRVEHEQENVQEHDQVQVQE